MAKEWYICYSAMQNQTSKLNRKFTQCSVCKNDSKNETTLFLLNMIFTHFVWMRPIDGNDFTEYYVFHVDSLSFHSIDAAC